MLPSLKLTSLAPENGWLEEILPFWDSADLQGANVMKGFRKGTSQVEPQKKTPYFPFCWFFHRDPYNGFILIPI